MSNNGEESENFLGRLRQFANQRVASALHSLIGLPSILSRPSSSSWALPDNIIESQNQNDMKKYEAQVCNIKPQEQSFKDMESLTLRRTISHDETRSGASDIHIQTPDASEATSIFKPIDNKMQASRTTPSTDGG